MLSLLRHAKSSWADASLDDFERPLTKRGASAASKLGRFLAREKLVPDIILCSDAVRARATVALLLPELGATTPKLVVESALYLALPAALLDRVRALDGAARHVMIVGHNPGLHALALSLTADGERDDIAALATKFPTAALAVITFPSERWSAVKPASGRLARFVTPRTLVS